MINKIITSRFLHLVCQSLLVMLARATLTTTAGTFLPLRSKKTIVRQLQGWMLFYDIYILIFFVDLISKTMYFKTLQGDIL